MTLWAMWLCGPNTRNVLHVILGCASTMEYINNHLAPYAWFRAWRRQLERLVNRSKPIASLLRDLRPDYLVLPNPFGTQETLYMVHARDSTHSGHLSDAQLGQYHLQRHSR